MTENVKKQEEPMGPVPEAQPEESVSLEAIMAELKDIKSMIAPSEPEAPVEIEAQKAADDKKEGAPEGTESASGGEGAEKKLPKPIAEETHEAQPGKPEGEKVKLEKSAELEAIKAELSDIKKSMKALNVTKSSTGRPAMNGKSASKDEDFALDIAKGKKKLDWSALNDKSFDADRENVLKAIGRSR